MKKCKIIFYILFIAVTLFIFANSAKPAVESSQQSGFLVRLFMEVFSIENRDVATVIVRKAAHIAEFFAQGAFLSAALFDSFRKNYIYVLFAGLFTAATDEFIQLFFEGRAGMIEDVFVDFSGTALAVLAAFILIGILKRRKNGVTG